MKTDIFCTSPVLDYLRDLHREFASVTEGKVATYIPELAKADPNWFGICLVTANGTVYEVGDSRQPFTIQSISKPFVYGLALEDNGRPSVLAKVGMEPTGDAFNSISLEPGTGRPRNPMINAGAIATTALIAGKSPATRLRRLLEMFALYAGRELTLDDAVYRSESETGHRNRAIGYMLRNFDILSEDPGPTVELYFQQCSVSVTCHDLGVMAATLANRGINPLTGKQAIRAEYVESVLSVMGSCGMYDYAGEWIYTIGMPAKSGVAGGVIAVLPGQLGIGVFSPPLDSRGNSVRGIRVCDALSRHCDLHLLNRPRTGKGAIRFKFTAAEINSSRVRTPQEAQALHQFGSSIVVYQLQGNLDFATAEAVVHDITHATASVRHLILDLKKVLTVNESASRLLYQLLLKMADAGRPVLFTHVDHLPLLRRYMKAKLGARFSELFRSLDDNDLALEWCENRLLEATLPAREPDRAVQPTDYELLQNFTPAEVEILTSLLKRRVYQQTEAIIESGDDAREMFFLARGNASVFVTLASGTRRRLATFSPGMVFGEMAVIDRSPRSARIVADTAVECDTLNVEDIERLGKSHPEIRIKFLENLTVSLCRRLRKANRELSLHD
ncbi:MAG: glutaminase A [Verrucomicrobia subdivision 3 bacterium]|nr:glutaminase A [Limisphaerales bacterium]